MIRRSDVALPHLVLGTADVTCDPVNGWWLAGERTEQGPIVLVDGGRVESWDALRPLALSRELNLPPDLVHRVGLRPSDTLFRVIVTATTGRGLYRQVLYQSDCPAEGGTISVAVVPAGDHLLRDLRLSTAIAVVCAVHDAPPLAPSAKGARIWEDNVRIQLEGGRARLPMEVLSFSETPAFRGFTRALFHVSVTGDATTDVEEALLVHLNADHSDFVSRIEAGEPVARSILWEGVVREVFAEILAQQALDGECSEPETLGALTVRWARQAFPGRSLTDVARLAKDQPASFGAAVSSWCGSVQRLFGMREGQ